MKLTRPEMWLRMQQTLDLWELTKTAIMTRSKLLRPHNPYSSSRIKVARLEFIYCWV